MNQQKNILKKSQKSNGLLGSIKVFLYLISQVSGTHTFMNFLHQKTNLN